MVSRGSWRRINDRSEWSGRRDAGRAYLKSARNACEVADEEDDGRLIVQGAILSAIAYSDALTIKVAGIRNEQDHQRLPATLRYALGNVLTTAEYNRLRRLLAQKDDSAYGHRRISMTGARAALEKAEEFALWAEGTLVRA